MRPLPVHLSLAELAAIHRAAELLGTDKSRLLLESALMTAEEYVASSEGGRPGQGAVFWSARVPQTVTSTVHVAPTAEQLERLQRAAAKVKVMHGGDVHDITPAAFIVGATLRALARRQVMDGRLAELRLPVTASAAHRRTR